MGIPGIYNFTSALPLNNMISCRLVMMEVFKFVSAAVAKVPCYLSVSCLSASSIWSIQKGEFHVTHPTSPDRAVPPGKLPMQLFLPTPNNYGYDQLPFPSHEVSGHPLGVLHPDLSLVETTLSARSMSERCGGVPLDYIAGVGIHSIYW